MQKLKGLIHTDQPHSYYFPTKRGLFYFFKRQRMREKQTDIDRDEMLLLSSKQAYTIKYSSCRERQT